MSFKAFTLIGHIGKLFGHIHHLGFLMADRIHGINAHIHVHGNEGILQRITMYGEISLLET